MTIRALILEMYAAFNRRDVDGTLVLMSEDVSWPKASEGGRVVGKQAIREYWTRQWVDFDPRLEVLEVVDREDGRTEVKVRQVVKDRKGDVLSEMELWHVYMIQDGLIERMDVVEGDGNAEGQSKAFAGGGH
jgi:ketosteroid isomerase-like protein